MMKRVVKYSKKLMVALINVTLYLFSFLIPKSDKIIIVGGWFGKRFADNSKYFFLNVLHEKEKLNVDTIVWITRDEQIQNELRNHGFLAYKTSSLLGIWYHFRAKYHVIDQTMTDINPFFSVRSKRINLWHGFPMKKIGIFMKENHHRKPPHGTIGWFLRKASYRGFWFDHYLLATSEYTADVLGRAFEIKEDRVLISGYPRNFSAFREDSYGYTSDNETKYLSDILNFMDKGYNIVGYFPTFRDHKETLLFGAEESDEVLEFLDFCEEKKIKVVGKYHFAGKNDKFEDVTSHVAFVNLPSETDLYTFISTIDILITDYSSLYYDFLLWKKPVIFFPYDLEYFIHHDRGFIYDFDEFTFGDKVVNCTQLRNLLSDGVEAYSESYLSKYRDQAEGVARKMFSDYENMTIGHLVERIRQL
ncbi:MAG: hypothetical protein EP343_23340 [Deltaproteobacteria bacterium]|nr:MAG: hypothetical protein EP343_23340 [Deltaproteobacteria bacterium]